MFKFRLEKILSLKEKIEEAKKNEIVNKKNNLISEMKTLDGSIELLKKRNEYTKYINYLKEVIVKLEKNIKMLELEAEKKRCELAEAVKERKVLDKFKEKEFEKYKKEEMKIESGIVNELVSYQYSVKEEE